ncbi:MAG: hypothetical protein ACKVWV_00835 [Planctomycetota bacterium]
MKDLPVHLLLFVYIGFAIVAMGAMYADMDDRAALRSLPRRLVWFFGGCAIVAAILLALEHTVASVS